MPNRMLPIALSFLLLAAGSAVVAQDFSVMLTRDQVGELNESAREQYIKAAVAADHVDYVNALEHLAAAATAAPEHVELQFLLAKTARGRAEITYGEESLNFYDLAASALRRLLSNPALGPEERVRVARESERVTEGRETLRARDDARMKDGYDLVMQIHQQRRLDAGLALGGQSQTIEDYLAPQEEETPEDPLTKEDIWPVLGAPGLAIEVPQPVQPQFGGYGGFDPAMAGFDPAMAGFDPAAPAAAPPAAAYAPPAGSNPFGAGAPQPGSDPFAQPSGYFGAPQGQPQPAPYDPATGVHK